MWVLRTGISATVRLRDLPSVWVRCHSQHELQFAMHGAAVNVDETDVPCGIGALLLWG